MNKFDFTMYAGETRVLAVTVTDEASAAIDLTGATVQYIAGSIEKSVGSGIELTDDAGGEFEISFLQGDTVNENFSTKHECKAILADGNVMVLFTGTLRVEKSLFGTMIPDVTP